MLESIKLIKWYTYYKGEKMKQYRKQCFDGTYNHDFSAFVDENMNVTEVCSICKVEYFHSSEEEKNTTNKINFIG